VLAASFGRLATDPGLVNGSRAPASSKVHCRRTTKGPLSSSESLKM
jgi:hypothetical protein